MKYNVCCTKIYNGSVEVEAESYSEAIELARMLIDEDKVEMGVRPMDVIFDDASPIKAKIIQTVFLGNIYNYFIQLGGQELRVQRITSGDEEDEKYVEGKEVGIRFVGEKYYTREEKADV